MRTMPVAEHQQHQYSPSNNDEMWPRLLADRRHGWAAFVRFSTWAVGITVVILLALLVFVV